MSEVIIYSADVHPLYDARIYRAACDRVSPARAAKAGRFVFEKDRALCIGAGLLLDIGLRAYGVSQKDASIIYGTNGKPMLALHPAIHFNLSHSGERVLAAFAASDVGCDIERCESADIMSLLRFFAPEERNMLQSADEAERQTLFYRLWTLKESFLKCIGSGLTVSPDSFCVLPASGGMCLRQQVSDGVFAFAQPDIAPGYQAAVCVRDEACSVRHVPVSCLI